MIASRRREFNQSWTAEKHQQFRAFLASQCGEPEQFRQSETPCFFPSDLIERTAAYGAEIVHQLLENREYLDRSTAAIPEPYRIPGEDSRPLFVQADFGLDQQLEPRLVEIQGFPSLYSYQPLVSDAYRAAYAIDDSLLSFPRGLSAGQYWDILGGAILGGRDPENVILLEIDPAQQKTRHDFLITEKKFGVKAVDLRELRRDGKRLFYHRNGKAIPIHRIYNRAIMDELERRGIALPFDLREEFDVEWAGHPNWFFRLSKFSLPFVRHPAVPSTRILAEAGDIGNPGDYVLKPLYSFAGTGVVVGPSREQLDAIPPERRSDYILQERVDFRPVIDTPYGMTKVEIRIMYIWTDSGMRHVNTIVRMGRGAQMGVDFNRGYQWVGASAAFSEIV